MFMRFKRYKTKLHMFLVMHLICQTYTILYYSIILYITQGDKWVVTIYMEDSGEVFCLLAFAGNFVNML